MRRLTVTVMLVALVAALLFLAGAGPSAPAGDGAQDKRKEIAVAPAEKGRPAPLTKLYEKAKFDAIEQSATTTLQDVLGRLAKARGVTFLINERAFKFEQLNDVARFAVAEAVGLPARETTLARRLQQVLDRVPVPSGATFAVRGDHVEITTRAALGAEAISSNEVAPADAEMDLNETIAVPFVNLVAQRQPLEDVLKELAEQVDFSLSLDPRVGEKARLPVNARLLNTPLDSALLVLAEMAELRPVRLDNLFFITTPDKADKLPSAWMKYKPRKKRVPDGLMITGSGGAAGM
jgi:hypothetical protein